MQDLKSKYEQICKFFQIEPNDFFQFEPKVELVATTNVFFSFFKKFAKEIEDSIPKTEKRRAGAPSIGGRAGAA